MINIGDLIPELKAEPKQYKVHFAIGPKDRNEAFYSFLNGTFKKWQDYQNQKNFERRYILSFIYLSPCEWMFAGIYEKLGFKIVDDHFEYETRLLNVTEDLIGRLIINYKKKFRASYLRLENHLDKFEVSEIKKTSLSTIPFPGYENVIVDYDFLKALIDRNDIEWNAALRSVKGIYLITDKNNGKLYVGSAYGDQAIWQRWKEYICTGHGGNTILKKLIKEEGIEYAKNFQFSILEITSKTSDDPAIQQRESYWKRKLLSRQFGYNDN